MPKQKVTVRQSGNGFALIGADGQVIRDGFKTLHTAWMYAGVKGLHKGRDRAKRETVIPAAHADEQIFGLPYYAHLSNRPYPRFFLEAKAGKWGTLIRLNDRHFGIRWGDYRRNIAAREVPSKNANGSA
jgi:hypothetical protein